ncbi:hypothetical protein KJ359_002838 [Pestalotiopsis sp. 9143b]|nr:hypothetical protein KJ359_002838 [Pestalotiopsis sp. 9143b]
MCFGSGQPRRQYYYREELTPVRQVHHGHHHHHHHPRASYPSPRVSTSTYRRSGPVGLLPLGLHHFDPPKPTYSFWKELPHFLKMNRALSIRSKTSNKNDGGSSRLPFSFGSLRGNLQPELSRKLYKLIKSTNNLITAHDTAAKERNTIATQLSEWGEQTQDEGVSDISDKVGVILSELGAQEDNYAQNLEESRGVLKAIRNTEKSVQPSRDNKAKIADEIQKLKMKEPQSTRLVVLEQELVRAEAENLVAEAQLSNVTRQKIKEAYDTEFAAVIERAERQIILAKHGRRLLTLLDDTPMTPGDAQREYNSGSEARQILNDAEDDLRNWEPSHDEAPFHDARDVAAEFSPPAAAESHVQEEPGLSDSSVQAEAQPTTTATPSAGVAA